MPSSHEIQSNPDAYSDSVILYELARAGQYGHSRRPSGFYLTGANTYGVWWPRGISRERKERIGQLSQRFRAWKYQQKEVLPGWVADESTRTYYADNSIEITERATDGTGRTRRVMLDGPHGDACF